ncbi:MAG: hypothetical protein ABDH49_02305 [Candidatus Hydrothermales bacterium]
MDISKDGVTKESFTLEKIRCTYFLNRNREEFIGYFSYKDNFYISSSSEILREQIFVLKGHTTKKQFPNIENLFLYFDDVVFKEFLKDYFKNIIRENFILENKIYPILNLIEIKEIYGTWRREKDRIIISLK